MNFHDKQNLRFVVTTVTCDETGSQLTLVQVAEKDMAFTQELFVTKNLLGYFFIEVFKTYE